MRVGSEGCAEAEDMSIVRWLWVTIQAFVFGFLAWFIWMSINDHALKPSNQMNFQVGFLVGGVVALLFASGLGYRAGRIDERTERSAESKPTLKS